MKKPQFGGRRSEIVPHAVFIHGTCMFNDWDTSTD